jgi:CheY-like chemotaxis protein
LLERLKSKIELVIVVVEVPDLDEWHLIGRLADHDQRPAKIALAISSTYTNKTLEDQMKRLGVDMVVLKPLPDEEWHKTLATIITGM